MEKYITKFDIFGETVNPNRLSAESRKIYDALQRYYEENIDKPPEMDSVKKEYHVEWMGLHEAYFKEIRKLREAKGVKYLTLEKSLDKLFHILDANFCLAKQEKRKAITESNKKSSG